MKRKSTLTAFLGLFLLSLALNAQAQSMEDRLESKKAKKFLKNGDWNLDYDAAKKKAKEAGKLVFIYFTRSYAP